MRYILISALLLICVVAYPQTSDPPTMEETPDTVANLGARKDVRQLINWNALRNRLDREDIDTLLYTVGDSAVVSITFTPVTNVSSPTEGMVYYNSDDDSLYCYVNTSWVALNGAGGGGGGGDSDSASVTYTFTPAATASLSEGGIRYDSDDDKWKGNDGSGTEYIFNPDSEDIDTAVHMLTDTLILVGNIGLNNPGDTASMLTTAQFEWPTVQDTVVFDSVYAYCYGTSGSVGVRIYEKDDPTDGTRTFIHAEISPTTGTPAGTSTFTQEASGPGKILGFALTTVTTKPTQVVCILFHHEKRAY